MKRAIAGVICASAMASTVTLAADDPTDAGQDLLLRCDGTATRTATDTTYANASNSSGQSASANVTSYRKERSEERLLLDIQTESSRIRVPKSMVPPVNSGGKDGWWTLSDVNTSADSITARFRLNPINKPTIRIDRRTGDIEMSGFGMTFRGSCERQDRTERKF